MRLPQIPKAAQYASGERFEIDLGGKRLLIVEAIDRNLLLIRAGHRSRRAAAATISGTIMVPLKKLDAVIQAMRGAAKDNRTTSGAAGEP